ELNSAALNGDLLVVNGGLSLNGSVTLNLSQIAGGTLVSGKLTLINYSGTWNGVGFANYADGRVFTLGANQWQINYNDTTGGSNFAADQTGSKYVTLTVVPEPGAWMSLLGGCGVLVGLRRRRGIA